MNQQLYANHKCCIDWSRVDSYLAGHNVFPRTVELDLTNRCSRACPMCPVPRSGAPVRELTAGFVDRFLGVLEGHTRGSFSVVANRRSRVISWRFCGPRGAADSIRWQSSRTEASWEGPRYRTRCWSTPRRSGCHSTTGTTRIRRHDRSLSNLSGFRRSAGA